VPDDLQFVAASIGLLGTEPSYEMMMGCADPINPQRFFFWEASGQRHLTCDSGSAANWYERAHHRLVALCAFATELATRKALAAEALVIAVAPWRARGTPSA
jgi:hypothetical protein